MQLDERKVAATLHVTNGSAIGAKLEFIKRSLVIGLLTRPFKGLSPSFVSKPVADI
jgi:hypothetical protein